MVSFGWVEEVKTHWLRINANANSTTVNYCKGKTANAVFILGNVTQDDRDSLNFLE